MKKNENDILKALSGLDERWIEEADPYKEGAADKVAGAGAAENVRAASRARRLRLITGVAAVAAVLIIGIAIVKLGVPAMKPGSKDKPGQTAATPTATMAVQESTPTPNPQDSVTPTPYYVPETTPTPTMYIPETTPTPNPQDSITPTMAVPETTPTPTPYSPEKTPTPAPTPTPYFPEQTPTPAPTPTPYFPEMTPTPTPYFPEMTPAPTPTPYVEPGYDLPFNGWSALRPKEKRVTLADVKLQDYYRYLSPLLLDGYQFNSATHRDHEDDCYDAVWFVREKETDRNFVGVIVRKKEDEVNYGSRLVSAADVEVYDVEGREDPLTIAGPEFYTAENAPIFRANDFTDEVIWRRLVTYAEGGEEYSQMCFSIEAGDYVLTYLFRGTLTDETAEWFLPGENAYDETLWQIPDKGTPPSDDGD